VAAILYTEIRKISALTCKVDFHVHWTSLIGHRANQITLLTGLVLLSAFALFMGLTQFSTPDMPGNDSFYHIKMAYLMRTESLKPDFIWLPLTILNPREFYDHHFLFHILLIPFTFGDLVTGAKWAAVIFSSLAFMVVWRLLDQQRVPYASLWALGLLAVSEAFIYRMSIPRAQSLSLALIALALHWLLTGKQVRLVFLGFIFVWFYNAFPLLLGIAGAYVLAAWLLERRLDLHPLLYAGFGITAGLIINPYFPYNLIFTFQHILPKLVETTVTSVGNEWFPYTTEQLLSNSSMALLLFCSAIFALGFNGHPMEVRTATGLFLVCLFGLMLFQSRRFIEYFPVFSLIFAAFAWAPLLARQPGQVQIQRQAAHKPLSVRARSLGAALTMLVILTPAIWITFQGSRTSIQGSKPYQLYAGASAWLVANTPVGERIFQTDWDDFPRLFFYNNHNTYLVGLDPTYMQLYDSDLYEIWVDITRGRVENPSKVIIKNFGASYVLSDLLHDGFLQQAERDPHLAEVYRDAEAVIFRVVNR
jgi:hypothetical protein